MSNSIGNLKNSGLQGNNFPWQLKMLQGQQCACDYLREIDLNTDQVEPLLVQILAAIQNGTDFEAALVVDANDLTWLEVRIWNGTTFDPPIYFLAGSNTPGTPVAPITYINPNTYLAQIVSNTTGLATEVTLDNIYTELQGGITVDALDLDIRDLDCATDSVSICGSDGTTKIPILVDSFGVVAIQDNGDFISVDSGAIQKTQNVLRISGASGALAPGIYSAMSFASVGTTNATVDSVILKPGETINIDAGGINNVLGGLSYDTTNVGSELLIVTLI
jgi:hypothetical protein